MTVARRFVLCALTFLLALSGASGQKPQGDRRPLTGLNNANIPTYRSVEAFLQANPKSSLLGAAL